MEETVRILMLEDNLDDALLIKTVIERAGIKFESTVVNSQKEFEAAINEKKFDLVLSDHSMPHFNSFEALKIAKAKYPQLPFILLTGAVSEDFAISIFKAGADDYILKDNMKRLPVAIWKAMKMD